MSEQEVRERLLAILSRMLENPPQYEPGADIFTDFQMDSLDQIEFLFNVGEEFGVKIEDETFEQEELRKFDRLVVHIRERQLQSST